MIGRNESDTAVGAVALGSPTTQWHTARRVSDLLTHNAPIPPELHLPTEPQHPANQNTKPQTAAEKCARGKRKQSDKTSKRTSKLDAKTGKTNACGKGSRSGWPGASRPIRENAGKNRSYADVRGSDSGSRIAAAGPRYASSRLTCAAGASNPLRLISKLLQTNTQNVRKLNDVVTTNESVHKMASANHSARAEGVRETMT